jgi:hypothetical protein
MIIQAHAAETPMVDKKKVYTKTYAVGTNDRIRLENRFGELKILTWDKAEIKVEITMTSKGSTDVRAQEILDFITIEDSKSGDAISFKTKIKSNNTKNGDKKYKDEGFSINYLVHMPSKSHLQTFNEFGPTIIPDYNGEISVTSKFGDLKTGKLTNPKKVNVEFGTATIESMSDGELEIKFSRAIVDNLNGSVNAVFQHCNGIQLNLDNNLRNVVIKNDFTNLLLNVTKNLSANFDINTHFGNFSNKTDFDITQEKETRKGPTFKQRFSGKSGNGGTNFKISTEFGEITVGHALKMELKEDKKGQRKRSTTI